MHRELDVRAAGRDADRARGRERRVAQLLVDAGRAASAAARPSTSRRCGRPSGRGSRSSRRRRRCRARRTSPRARAPASRARYSSTSTWSDRARVEPVLRSRRGSSSRRPGDAAAGAAEREGRPHDRRHREVDVGRVGDDRRAASGCRRRARSRGRARGPRRAGSRSRSAPISSTPQIGELDREVERRLAAERRQDRVRLLALDHLARPSRGRAARGRSRRPTRGRS